MNLSKPFPKIPKSVYNYQWLMLNIWTLTQGIDAMPTKKQTDVHELTEKLAGLSEDALNKIDAVVENVQKRTEKYSDMTQDYVQKYPLKSLGIAVAAGALLALIIRK